MSAQSEKSQADHDDIEYNITFPAVNYGEKEPVVFLLGWVGSKDKHLAKYSAIYEQEGCVTVRYIHPTTRVFFTDPAESEEHKKAALKLVQLLEDYDLSENPVFIHVFSNGGYFVYRFLADAFHRKKINVSGGIFDSCPSRLEYLVGVRVLFQRNVLPNRFVSLLAAFAFTMYYIYLLLKSSLGFDKWPDLYQLMRSSTHHTWPHLFLYSSADVIVPKKHIEDMCRSKTNSKCPFVESHDFKTSPHVMHFKVYPEIYAEKCVQFLNDCLRLYMGDPIDDEELLARLDETDTRT